MPSFDFATIIPVATASLRAGMPVMLQGNHGIGKSQVAYQIAEDLGLPVVEKRASQLTEGDLLGMPSPDAVEVNGIEATTMRPFSWLIRACTEPVLLFLDEVDRATLEVRQGLFELGDSRKIADWRLHPGTLIMAAVNGGNRAGAASYQVNEMDPAEADRWATWEVQPSVEDWLSWARGRGKIAEIICDFIAKNPEHLEFQPGQGGFEPGKVYPSRRSWARFHEVLAFAGCISEPKEHLDMLYVTGTGFVGAEAAVSFKDFVARYEFLLTPEDILDRNQWKRAEGLPINDLQALADKIVATGRCTGETPMTATEAQNLANFWVNLPSEVAMVLFSEVGKSSDANIMALHGAVAENGVSVIDRLVQIS
jgi:hypothetical protein